MHSQPDTIVYKSIEDEAPTPSRAQQARPNDELQIHQRERHRRSRAPSPEEKLVACEHRYEPAHTISPSAQFALKAISEHVTVQTSFNFSEETRLNDELTWRLRGDDFNITQTLILEDVDAVVATIITYINDVVENGTTLSWPVWKARVTEEQLASSNKEDNEHSSAWSPSPA
ncbi:hypothetical protein P171DRAFT_491729 [Karstenula rhodostoma CBS 690.94]|uniref:Uncharacterized protein n=1 Tax=Karstenula rhodostoma CBS 690.94 TaxID=1392251 RepID=A0A9P4U694_9PLEO|nr:hypothetical protein P171DRAFT_491729 [Karstenula rhodostoma CBS 690.94]